MSLAACAMPGFESHIRQAFAQTLPRIQNRTRKAKRPNVWRWVIQKDSSGHWILSQGWGAILFT
jgi:hypothetical protein